MKYIIEIKPEYEDSFKGLMILGVKDSNLFVDTLAVENLEVLNSDYINEHYGSLQDDAYKRGLEDGKAIHEKGCEGCKYEWVEKDEEPCAHCAICYINHWTAKQTDDHIKVGDTVNIKGVNNDDGIVTKIWNDSRYNIVWPDGSSGVWDKKYVVKTGRHFDIASILEEMRHD